MNSLGEDKLDVLSKLLHRVILFAFFPIDPLGDCAQISRFLDLVVVPVSYVSREGTRSAITSSDSRWTSIHLRINGPKELVQLFFAPHW